jgi:hypothetical protein
MKMGFLETPDTTPCTFYVSETLIPMSDGMADMALTATTNLEELANSGMLHLKRPRLLLFAVTFTAIFFVAGVQPLRAAIQLQFTPVLTVQERFGSVHLRRTTLTAEDISVAKAPIPPVAASILPYTCGDGKCESPAEDALDCLADCPGVTTPAMCGEEPHSDPGGEAVAWGITHKTASATECCERCSAHAAKPANAKKPCNSWSFCPLPQCWSLDTGHRHTFGECWLKWQVDPAHPLYGQRGKYTEPFRRANWKVHAHNNLTVPSHVPWTGGIMGGKVDLSVRWETGPAGMTSSQGESLVQWRAWESAEENRRRGVPAHLLHGEKGVTY